MTGGLKFRDPVEDAIAGINIRAPVERVLVRLEAGLKRSIPRTPEWMRLGEWLLEQEHTGRRVEQWVAWYRRDRWRRENTQFVTPDMVRDSWPVAFVGNE